MQAFLYFIPGKREADFAAGKSVDTLAAVGLSHLECREFPRDGALFSLSAFGKSGVFIAPNVCGIPQDVITFNERSQHWVECGGHYVGVVKTDLPSPELIKRSTFFEQGWLVPDPAGRQWLIVIAKSPVRPCSIPFNYGFTPDGRPVPRPKKEFDWLWQLADKLEAHWYGDLTLPIEDLVVAAVKILGVNYQISFGEVNALVAVGAPILDNNFVQHITLCALDHLMRPKPEPAATAENDTPAAESAA